MPSVRHPLAVAAAYLAVGFSWIALTDLLVGGPMAVAQWQTAKGWVFVALSGVIVFLLARKAGQREQSLLERENELIAITDNLPGPVSRVDRAGHYRFANAAYQAWFGLVPAEVIGRTQREVLGPDLYARVEPHIRRALAGEQVQYVAPTQLPGGETRWGLVSLIPDRNADGEVVGHFTVALDITERHLAEQARIQSEKRYARLVETAPDAIFVNRGGRVVLVNGACLRLFGADSREQLLGKTPYELFHPDDHAQIRERIERMLETDIPAPPVEEHILRIDGHVVDAEVSAATFMDGNEKAIHIILRDITARKQSETEIQQLNSELEARVAQRTEELRLALQRAETADRVKSAFLASMSHELRTPLNSIIGFTGILLQELPGPLNGEQRKQLAIVRDASRHLLVLINDVLDISKIEAGQLRVECEPFDLQNSIGKVISLIRSQAEKKGLVLEVTLDPAIGGARGDARRVEQVLMNLLSNAIKFTEYGRVSLMAECVSVDNGCPAVRLRVADTGIGISEDDQAHVFDPFHQVESPLSRQQDGTGLGLAIARSLTHLMGGGIQLQSEPQKGSEFILILPLNCEEPQ